MASKSDKELAGMKQLILQGQPVNQRKYCYLMLEKVSRTFALTIKALGSPFKDPVMLGYLFCRIADTFEDSAKLSDERKIALLQDYYRLFQSEGKDVGLMWRLKSACAVLDMNDDEEFLVGHLDIVFCELHSCNARTRKIIRDTVTEMVAGMQATVQRSLEQKVLRLRSENELDRYCYYVAGTVGHMLTRLFAEFSPWISKRLKNRLAVDQEAFGAGLQLTNIIKDAVVDLQRNTAYIPTDLADKYNVPLDRIHEIGYRSQARSMMRELIVKAVTNLNYALRYCLLIPKTEPRIRLFCLWPLFMAIRTLRKAVLSDELFNPGNPVKISRREVRSTIRFTMLACFWDYLIVREFRRLVGVIESKLEVEIPLPLKNLKYLPVTLT
ncbi:MAG: hypothetical protein GF398_20445 [Chitinivibrionales bacterium]|nr:hypothetical protein [Chitinivibrionales bacterium]